MKRPVAVECEEPSLYIYWTLTDFCNFRCNYCSPFLHSGDYHNGRHKGFPSDRQIITFLDKLEEISSTKKLTMILSGGEPTLHRMLPYIVARLRKMNCYIGITTNGTRDVDFWQSILPISSVSISLHPEFTKIEKINKISKVILDSGTLLNYNLSCDPKNWSDTQSMYANLGDEFKPFVRTKILHRIGVIGHLEGASLDYSQEQREWMSSLQVKFPNRIMNKDGTEFLGPEEPRIVFDDNSYSSARRVGEITMKEWHNFEGWNCRVGSESINVHYTGDVFAGICKSKFLGKLNNFELLDDYIICPLKRCVSPADIRVNKRR